jgi:hypothetical protein
VSYAATQAQHKRKLEARRKKGAGRTDGPRRQKGVPTYRLAKKLKGRHIARIEKAAARKTHDVVMGIDTKTGQPVLRMKERPKKEATA